MFIKGAKEETFLPKNTPPVQKCVASVYLLNAVK